MEKRETTSKKSDLDPHHHLSLNAQGIEVVETEISIENATVNETALETTNQHHTNTAQATALTARDRGAAKRTEIASTDVATAVTIRETLKINPTSKRRY
jgi:hypothetical protein